MDKEAEQKISSIKWLKKNDWLDCMTKTRKRQHQKKKSCRKTKNKCWMCGDGTMRHGLVLRVQIFYSENPKSSKRCEITIMRNVTCRKMDHYQHVTAFKKYTWKKIKMWFWWKRKGDRDFIGKFSTFWLDRHMYV